MLIRFVILIFFLIFSVYSDDKKLNEKQIKNIIEKYILDNPEIIIESLEQFTADQKEKEKINIRINNFKGIILIMSNRIKDDHKLAYNP